MKQNSIHQLPQELRTRIDTWFIDDRLIIADVLRQIKLAGHAISKSALARYRKNLFDGQEDLNVLSVGSRPLAAELAAAVAAGDADAAEIVHELTTLALRQFATLRRAQRLMRDRKRAAQAREWTAAERLKS